MGWRDLSSWLKGGIIGLLFSVAVSLLSIIYFLFCFNAIESPSYCLFINFLNYPESFFFFLNSLWLNFTIYILTGAFIGLIVGKFKNKKGVSK